MNLTATTLIGFLSGSLVTIIIKNIFEIINHKIEFKRELKKKFFDKKLDAADKAVATIYSMANSIGILSASYEMMANPNKDFNYEVFKHLIVDSSDQMKKLSEDSMKMNSIYLYTDIDSNPTWTETDDKILLDGMSDLVAQDTNLLNALSAYDNAVKNKNVELQKKIWSDVEKLAVMYKIRMKEVSEILIENKIALLEQRKRLRSEFKKYDL